jgi:hypothetical protein
MSRSGYNDHDCDYSEWSRICWRGAVASATKGKRGQMMLKELLSALDALGEKRLIADDLVRDGEVCALGALGMARGLDMSGLDPEDNEALAGAFGIARALTAEIMYMNDERFRYDNPTPEDRFHMMRLWITKQINH